MIKIEIPTRPIYTTRSLAEEIFYTLGPIYTKKNKKTLEKLTKDILLSQLNKEIENLQHLVKVADYQIVRIKQKNSKFVSKIFSIVTFTETYKGVISAYNARKIYYNGSIRDLEIRKLELQKL